MTGQTFVPGIIGPLASSIHDPLDPTYDQYWTSVPFLLPGAGTVAAAPTDVLGHALTVTTDAYSTTQAKFGSTSIANPSGGFITNTSAGDRTL